MKDITYCSATECPSTECKIKISNNHFKPNEVISMADFAGVCRFYIGWMITRTCDTCAIAQNYNLEDDDSPCLNCGAGE